jgi:hypothetical protein
MIDLEALAGSPHYEWRFAMARLGISQHSLVGGVDIKNRNPTVKLWTRWRLKSGRSDRADLARPRRQKAKIPQNRRCGFLE